MLTDLAPPAVHYWHAFDFIRGHRAIHVAWKMEAHIPAAPAASCHQPRVVRGICFSHSDLFLSCALCSRRYSAFEVVGAWANTGMSLVDQSLVPFQTAYPMLIFLIWVAVAGNTGFVSAPSSDSLNIS